MIRTFREDVMGHEMTSFGAFRFGLITCVGFGERPEQPVVLLARDREHAAVTNRRGKVKFIPGRLLIAGHLKPWAVETCRHGKTIRHSRILLVIEIPGFAVRRSDKRGSLAEAWADGRTGVGIG